MSNFPRREWVGVYLKALVMRIPSDVCLTIFYDSLRYGISLPLASSDNILVMCLSFYVLVKTILCVLHLDMQGSRDFMMNSFPYTHRLLVLVLFQKLRPELEDKQSTDVRHVDTTYLYFLMYLYYILITTSRYKTAGIWSPCYSNKTS